MFHIQITIVCDTAITTNTTEGMLDEATKQLQRVRNQLWGLNAVMMVYLFIWLSWGLTTWGPNRHSYGLSLPAPGVLVSDHWSPDHMLTMLLIFFFLVPWTLAFMSDAPRREWRRWLHMIGLLVLFLLSIALLGVDIWHITNANVASADNALNPANDERWCCLYATLNPDACAPISATNPCAVVPPASALGWSVNFRWSFFFLLGWMLLMLLDVLWAHYSFGRAIVHYEAVLSQGGGNDLEAASSQPKMVAPPEFSYKQLPFHVRRQQELLLAAAAPHQPMPSVSVGPIASSPGNANKKYAGRSNKR